MERKGPASTETTLRARSSGSVGALSVAEQKRMKHLGQFSIRAFQAAAVCSSTRPFPGQVGPLRYEEAASTAATGASLFLGHHPLGLRCWHQ